jgi:hypothetical protein
MLGRLIGDVSRDDKLRAWYERGMSKRLLELVQGGG